MLPTTLILEVRRLLDLRELSQRAIARRVGVSRGVVAEMAKGLRGDYGRDLDDDSSRASPKRELTTPVRCPDCDGMVYAPCRLCRARAARAAMLAARMLLRKPVTPPRRAA
jgi:transcriptional regulator with XRE-family HTH domain